MNETRTGARVVVDTRFADLSNGLFDNCKIAVLMSGICFRPDADSLQNMIVEGLSMAAALKERLKPLLAPKGYRESRSPLRICASCDHRRDRCYYLKRVEHYRQGWSH